VSASEEQRLSLKLQTADAVSLTDPNMVRHECAFRRQDRAICVVANLFEEEDSNNDSGVGHFQKSKIVF